MQETSFKDRIGSVFPWAGTTYGGEQRLLSPQTAGGGFDSAGPASTRTELKRCVGGGLSPLLAFRSLVSGFWGIMDLMGRLHTHTHKNSSV